MKVNFNALAEQEFIEAARWYQEQRDGLGEEFIAAIQAATEIIATDPGRFQPTGGDVRICRIKSFPYYIFFRVLSKSARIRILAIAHQKRRPGYWQGRA